MEEKEMKEAEDSKSKEEEEDVIVDEVIALKAKKAPSSKKVQNLKVDSKLIFLRLMGV